MHVRNCQRLAQELLYSMYSTAQSEQCLNAIFIRFMWSLVMALHCYQYCYDYMAQPLHTLPSYDAIQLWQWTCSRKTAMWWSGQIAHLSEPWQKRQLSQLYTKFACVKQSQMSARDGWGFISGNIPLYLQFVLSSSATLKLNMYKSSCPKFAIYICLLIYMSRNYSSYSEV